MPDSSAPGGTLCVHLGDKVGYCYGPASIGAWILPKSGDHGCMGAALIDAVSDMSKLLQPGRIVLSGPPNEVETTTCPDVAVLHLGLLMCVRVFAFRRKIRMVVPNIEAVREKMLGRGDFSRARLKDAVLGLARRRGLAKVDLDAAHALVVWEYFQEQLVK